FAPNGPLKPVLPPHAPRPLPPAGNWVALKIPVGPRGLAFRRARSLDVSLIRCSNGLCCSSYFWDVSGIRRTSTQDLPGGLPTADRDPGRSAASRVELDRRQSRSRLTTEDSA